jgi:hypothetical protein
MVEFAFGTIGTITFILIGGPTFVIGGSAAIRAANGEHLNWQWQTAGWIFGALNGALGAFYIASDHGDFPMILGIAHVTIGAASIGITIWGSCIPEEKGVAISPMVLPPPTGVEVGEPALGLVVSGRF